MGAAIRARHVREVRSAFAASVRERREGLFVQFLGTREGAVPTGSRVEGVFAYQTGSRGHGASGMRGGNRGLQEIAGSMRVLRSESPP